MKIGGYPRRGQGRIAPIGLLNTAKKVVAFEGNGTGEKRNGKRKGHGKGQCSQKTLRLGPEREDGRIKALLMARQAIESIREAGEMMEMRRRGRGWTGMKPLCNRSPSGWNGPERSYGRGDKGGRARALGHEHEHARAHESLAPR